MGRRSVVAVFVALGALAFAHAVARASPDSPAAVIQMTNSKRFEPAQITIKVGQTVQWVNTSDQVHTVTDDPNRAHAHGDSTLPPGAKPFNSGALKARQTFSYTFAVPGTYHYFCLPHEEQHMVGVVVVEP